MRFQTYESPVTLLDLLASIFRYKWRALLVSTLMFVVVMAGILLFPKRFQSEAKLFVRLGRGAASMDPATIGQTISIQESRETEMNSIIDMLESRALAERIVEDIGPDRLLKKYAWIEVQIESASDWFSTRLEPLLAQADVDPNELSPENDELSPLTMDEQKRFELATKEIEDNLRVSSPKRSTTLSIAYRAREPELAKAVVESVIAN